MKYEPCATTYWLILIAFFCITLPAAFYSEHQDRQQTKSCLEMVDRKVSENCITAECQKELTGLIEMCFKHGR